jgi:hypothetical protein
MTSDDDALTRDLEQKLGSKDLARRVRESVLRLRDGAGGEQLAEMARDLLDGRIDLRTIGRSSAYAGPLTAAARRYQDWFSNLSPEEQESVMTDAREELNGLDSGSDEPHPGTRG